tara:strand:+ start:356 stop:1240 length:885 start_codon:yes stop_codon:yes gene_type:complete
MKILLTGANGKVGSEVFNKLNKNYDLTSISLKDGKIKKNFYKLDLTNKSDVFKFSNDKNRFDVIIFLVGLAHKKGKKNDLEEFNKLNFLTLKNLLSSLQNANKLPKKIIFSSSISVYGEELKKQFYYEDSTLSPSSPYAITKLKAENYLSDNFKSISWILRFAPVYSNDFNLNIDRRTKIWKIYYKVGSKAKKLSLCNLSNIIKTIYKIIEGRIPSGVYNVSDQSQYSYEDLLNYQRGHAIIIPYFIISFIFQVGLLLNNIFIIENCIKLLSDNIFPSDKLNKFVNLNYNLKSL